MASQIQIGGFFTRSVGVMLDIGLSGGSLCCSSLFQRHSLALEAQVFPWSVGPLWVGAFAKGGAAIANDSVSTQTGPMFGGGALVELALTTRLALSFRAGANAAHFDDGWSTAGTLTAGSRFTEPNGEPPLLVLVRPDRPAASRNEYGDGTSDAAAYTFCVFPSWIFVGCAQQNQGSDRRGGAGRRRFKVTGGAGSPAARAASAWMRANVALGGSPSWVACSTSADTSASSASMRGSGWRQRWVSPSSSRPVEMRRDLGPVQQQRAGRDQQADRELDRIDLLLEIVLADEPAQRQVVVDRRERRERDERRPQRDAGTAHDRQRLAHVGARVPLVEQRQDLVGQRLDRRHHEHASQRRQLGEDRALGDDVLDLGREAERDVGVRGV